MDKKTLSMIALIAGAFGIFTGIWGLVDPVDGTSAAEIEENIMWIAIAIVSLGISAVCSALASRR